MPKIVDHDARRQEIAAAMWKVLYRDGIAAVTVRSVAAEAGLSKATLGYYFSSQNDLLMFAMAESMAVSSERIRKMAVESGGLDPLTRALAEAVPTTPKRRQQSEIWLCVVSRAQESPQLRRHLAEVDGLLLDQVRECLQIMGSSKLLSKKRDIELEAQRLHALIDGLTLHTLTDSAALPGSTIRRILRLHLESLSS